MNSCRHNWIHNDIIIKIFTQLISTTDPTTFSVLPTIAMSHWMADVREECSTMRDHFRESCKGAVDDSQLCTRALKNKFGECVNQFKVLAQKRARNACSKESFRTKLGFENFDDCMRRFEPESMYVSSRTIWMDLTNICQDVAEWFSDHPIAAGIIALSFMLLLIALLFEIRKRFAQSAKARSIRSIGIQTMAETNAQDQIEIVISKS